MKDDREQRTLFAAELADPRVRARLPEPPRRGRAAARAETTSDVTRVRPWAIAGVASALGTLGAVAWAPPSGGLRAEGAPLALPHAAASLECKSCHGEHEETSPKGREAARTACVGCHGPHPSTRAGHRRATEAGAMGCVTCHQIHRTEQGVRVAGDLDDPERVVRFAPGREATLEIDAPAPAGTVTVPIIPASACASCHDLGAAADPLAACLSAAHRDLGGLAPTLCFDEHQAALPASAPDVRPPGRRAVGGEVRREGRDALPVLSLSSVCADQHFPDRPLAWEAGRAAALEAPVLSGSAGGGSPVTWLLGGASAGLVALAAGATLRRVQRRLRDKRDQDAPIPRAADRVRLPTIDTSTCLGCYACVDACPYDVLEIEKYVAVVARPDACCGLTLCEQRCPNGSLRITDGAPIGDRPRIGDDLQSQDVPGLYLAGDITGLPLIKNAIAQGSRAVDEIARSLREVRPRAAGQSDVLDLVIVGAGPAGISAALRAKELGLSAVVIEQGNVAQSIRSFPRGKLVFDQPLELPVAGKLWLEESTKEELLSQWLRILHKERLRILEETRMVRIARDDGGHFAVDTEPREGGAGATHRARRVLVSIGQRGTPRRLDVPLDSSTESRVFYHLSDARSFEGQRVVVVGLGDVAMETMIALGRQPGTTVIGVHRGEGFSRGSARNIREVERLVAAGRVELRFGVTVAALDPERIHLRSSTGQVHALPYDAVLVMIGNIPPWSTLERLGVRRREIESAPGP